SAARPTIPAPAAARPAATATATTAARPTIPAPTAARPAGATPAQPAAGPIMAATAGMGTAGRRLAGAKHLAAGSRQKLVFRPSHLGAARRLRRLLRSSGHLQSQFRQPALLPHANPPRYVHGISALLVRRLLVPAGRSVSGILAGRLVQLRRLLHRLRRWILPLRSQLS